MTKKIFNNLTFWVILLGIAGYVSAILFADKSWLTATEVPLFYEFVLMIKSLFLKLLKMLIAPVIFISVIAGLLNLGNVARLKTLGKTTLGYYLLTTGIAIAIGLVVVFFIHPWEQGATLVGAGSSAEVVVQQQGAELISESRLIDPASSSMMDVVRLMLEKAFVNPFTALADLNILGIVFNAFLLGIAMVVVVPQDSPLVTAIMHLNMAINKLLSWVILITPIGVFAIIFDFAIRIGGDIVSQLFSFSMVVFGATMVHGLVVLPLIAYLLTGTTPRQLFSKILNPLAVAFSTSSSSATLPVTIQTCRSKLGITKSVAGFVLPLGATMNMDGSALFEGVAAVFLAYLFGIDLSNTAIVAIFLMAMISSIGAPGMPSGSMSGMQMVLLAAGIPLEAIAILLVVERPLDTFRTAVNVEGDIIGALVVQKTMNKHGVVFKDKALVR